MSAPPKVLLYDFADSICCQMVRLALAEKGVTYARRNVDISETQEQFEPWYLALNPKGVVPTLQIGDEVIVDTKVIVDRVDADFPGPRLSPTEALGRERMAGWKDDIMGLHYGVLLYSRELGPTRVHPRIAERGAMLEAMLQQRPEAAAMLQPRIDGNRRFQGVLADPVAVGAHIDAAFAVVRQIDAAVSQTPFVVGDHYSLADCFATAMLARLRLHGYASAWERDLPALARYYAQIRARPSFASAGVVESN